MDIVEYDLLKVRTCTCSADIVVEFYESIKSTLWPHLNVSFDETNSLMQCDNYVCNTRALTLSSNHPTILNYLNVLHCIIWYIQVGDDVVFGSRSVVLTSSAVRSAKVVFESGAMVADR